MWIIIDEANLLPIPSERSNYPLDHIYARPPEPGDRAYCGHLWTPDEAEAIHRGERLVPCNECVIWRNLAGIS